VNNPIPVIIGVGQLNDRESLGEESIGKESVGKESSGLDSLGLMEAALRAADHDAGGGWLAILDSLGVVDQISWPELGDVSTPLAERLGATPRFCYKSAYGSGDSPLLLLNEAANRIGAGEIKVAAVVGGEALRTAARRAALTAPAGASSDNAVRAVSMRRGPSYRHRYGLIAPVDVYPLYENAGRAAYGQTLAQGQEESAEIWSRFSAVAAENPGAWLRRRVSADEIKTVSAANRPIAFPYCKLMVANSSVNQGAGFIVTSLAEARARGVADDRMIFVGRGAAAHEPVDVMARAGFVESPSMAVSLRQALALNELSTAGLDHVELYSCFPCVPKMARRVIGWPLHQPATVFGGLTFGGGPVGNYMSHAVVSMVVALRQRGRCGLLFANGGLATHSHSMVLGRAAFGPNTFPQNFDYQPEADAMRGPVPPIEEDYIGPASVETYTVFYDREGSARQGVIVARSTHGSRFIAKVPDADRTAIRWLTSGEQEPVGAAGTAIKGPDGDTWWRMN
jgi:acetyl-CoA C-acetyltransferase